MNDAKQYLQHPTCNKISFNPELAKAYGVDDAIILSTLIRICHRKLVPGTMLDDDYYAAITATELHQAYFSFWDYDYFIKEFLHLIKAGLILYHRMASPYLTDRSSSIIHYAPNYASIYKGLLWTKNK